VFAPRTSSTSRLGYAFSRPTRNQVTTNLTWSTPLKRIETVGTSVWRPDTPDMVVSVSSSGSRRSELYLALPVMARRVRFSILKRIETVGTRGAVDVERHDAVSVSSSGSRRSERECGLELIPGGRVSVSSSGSRRSELAVRVWHFRATLCFSILKRIETVGTLRQGRRHARADQVSVSSSGSRRSELVWAHA